MDSQLEKTLQKKNPAAFELMYESRAAVFVAVVVGTLLLWCFVYVKNTRDWRWCRNFCRKIGLCVDINCDCGVGESATEETKAWGRTSVVCLVLPVVGAASGVLVLLHLDRVNSRLRRRPSYFFFKTQKHLLII